MRKPNRVLVVGAMDRELAGLRAHYACAPHDALLGAYPFCTAERNGVALSIVQTHVGEVNAALATREAIARCAPQVVLKLGCVGGHSAGLHTGDIVLSLGYFHSGAWITRDFESGAPTADAARWGSAYGDAPYQVNRENLGGRAPVLPADDALTTQLSAHVAQWGECAVPAYIGGGAMWIFDRAMMNRMLPAQVPDARSSEWVADMESYAIAQVCAVCAVPFSGLYRVSNSEFHGEAYQPDVIASFFSGWFIDIAAAFIERDPAAQV
jgi:nucleoside phosphorylase